jgi:hypothetical protein
MVYDIFLFLSLIYYNIIQMKVGSKLNDDPQSDNLYESKSDKRNSKNKEINIKINSIYPFI